MTVIEDWIAREKDASAKGTLRRKGVVPSQFDLDREFEHVLGAALKSALELLDGEEVLFVAGSPAATVKGPISPGRVDGLNGRPLVTEGVIVVTRRQFLAVDQTSSKQKEGKPPVSFARAISMLSHFERRGGPKDLHEVDMTFTKQEASVWHLMPDDADRLVEVLTELTGG